MVCDQLRGVSSSGAEPLHLHSGCGEGPARGALRAWLGAGALASGRGRTVLLPLLSCLARPFLTPAAPPVCIGLRISATLCAGYSCAGHRDLDSRAFVGDPRASHT